jgi:hypothetical protein
MLSFFSQHLARKVLVSETATSWRF